MNKTAIKNFAVWARRKLISEITYKAGLIGITEKGISNPLSMSTDNIQFFDIGTGKPTEISDHEIKQREALVNRIKEKEGTSDYKTAFQFVVEEVAYTWFNRLIAIRFMEVNDYLPSRIRVLSSETSGKSEPDMVTTPFDTDMAFSAYEKDRVMQLKHENELDELFRILFIKQCNKLNEVLPELFEKTADYTELLLTISFTDSDGMVSHLVNDIFEEDFKEAVEIIGWMYQYYNSEPKDEVFALLKKNVKITKDRIPAATQLFTPDWIVRYMVENSLGRLWVEGHPNDSLRSEWNYYLEEAEQDENVKEQLEKIRGEYKKLNPEDIKVIDPCMGSGHILVYAFDVLMQIYESQGYTQRDAATAIIEKNLYGLDIDDRAYQLAYFAMMMKARQYNRRILNGKTRCNIYSVQESNKIDLNQLQYFGTRMSEIERSKAMLQIKDLLKVFFDAKEYGTVLNIENYEWDLLHQFISYTEIDGQMTIDTIGIEDTKKKLNLIIQIGDVMAKKYNVVITNPPYMSSSGMNSFLADFIKNNYPNSKTDLYSAFIEKCLCYCKEIGFVSMMTSYTWMFLSSFENIRKIVLDNHSITSLIQPEYHAFFDEAYVPICTFTIRKSVPYYKGSYIQLEKFYGADIQAQKVLEATSNPGCGYLFYSSSEDFERIKSKPIVYWASKNLLKAFSNKTIGEIAKPRQGLATGENDRFTRQWFEVCIDNFKKDATSREEALNSMVKWFPYNKGGEFRKWYGNNDCIVDWANDGFEIRNFKDSKGKLRSRPQNMECYFKPSITWSKISSGSIAFRYKPSGHIFDVAGTSIFVDDDNLFYLHGFCNSKVALTIAKMLSPTLNYEVGHISSFPVIMSDNKSEIEDIVKRCIEISKIDWDAYETSWDFIKHPLLKKHNTNIKDAFLEWQQFTEYQFTLLKSNEEKLNRVFIHEYSVQDELTSEIDDKDITIRKADLGRDIRSFISYAVGCMFGRYSLDIDGIAYAGGTWNECNYSSYIPDKDNCIPITDEEYFSDDIVGRFVEFVKCVYGPDNLEENLNFIARALDNKGDTSKEIIRNYFVKDFYKDHVKIYQKRPIYWLYDSGKLGGFKALVYMHRFNVDTTGIVRVDYLHKIQKIYMSEIDRMKEMAENSNDAREVAQAEMRREKLIKQLKETKEYDEKIAHLALSRIAINLDDGVKVNYEKVQTGQDGKKLDILAKI